MSWWHLFRHHRKYVEVVVLEELKIIVIENEPYHKRKKLAARYFFDNFQILTSMATIQIPGNKTQVVGQIVPLAENGSELPLDSIQPDSDNYVSSDTSVATVTKGADGSFTVIRVSTTGGNATISYSAKNVNGEDISGSDNFIIDSVVIQPPVAKSLTAVYSDPT